jgi:Zn-dependent protease
MNASIKLGRVWGIPIGLHWNWFIIFFLITISLSMGYFRLVDTGLGFVWIWLLGIVTSLLFFLSVLAHEFGHAIIALRNGIPVNSIVLFILGGVAHIGEEPRTAGAEFRIAIAGPAVSFLLAVIFWLIGTLFQGLAFLTTPAMWLAQVNLALAAFNMLPGFPLDGGRVFRALIWAVTHNFQRATRVASISGQLVAFGFIGYGIVTLFGGNLINGVWMAFIGWFLQNAALSSRSHIDMQETMDSIKVAQVMDSNIESVSGKLSITQLVEEKFLPSGRNHYLIMEAGAPTGVVTLQEVVAVPRKDWDSTPIDRVMTPWDQIVQLQADMGLSAALSAMDFRHAALAPVLENGRIAGSLSRDQINQYIQLWIRHKI